MALEVELLRLGGRKVHYSQVRTAQQETQQETQQGTHQGTQQDMQDAELIGAPGG